MPLTDFSSNALSELNGNTPQGNRCGHCPKIPRFFMPTVGNKTLPSVLESAKEALQQFYHQPHRWLNYLNEIQAAKTDRQIRSERREAIAAVIGAILQHTDLATLKMGRIHHRDHQTPDILPITIDRLALYAKVHPKRCYRVMQSLQQAGYIQLERQAHLKDHQWKSLPAIKRVNAVLFFHLGVSVCAFNQARHRTRKRLEKLFSPIKTAVTSVLSVFTPKYHHRTYCNKSERSTEQSCLTESQSRRLYEKIERLREKNPSVPLLEIDRLSRLQLGFA